MNPKHNEDIIQQVSKRISNPIYSNKYNKLIYQSKKKSHNKSKTQIESHWENTRANTENKWNIC